VVNHTARLRVRLSANEVGCELRIAAPDGTELLRKQLVQSGPWHAIELPVAGESESPGGPFGFVVHDAVGNRTERSLPMAMRERSLDIAFGGEPHAAAMVGDELVVSADGARVPFTCGDAWRVVRADFVL